MKYLTSAIQFIAANPDNQEAIGSHLASLLNKITYQIGFLESQRRLLRELLDYHRLRDQLNDDGVSEEETPLVSEEVEE